MTHKVAAYEIRHLMELFIRDSGMPGLVGWKITHLMSDLIDDIPLEQRKLWYNVCWSVEIVNPKFDGLCIVIGPYATENDAIFASAGLAEVGTS